MTIEVNSEGDFAENSLTSANSPSNANVVSDLYDILTKGNMEERDFSTVTLAYEASREIFTNGGGSDNDKWCKIGDQNDSPEELRLIEKTSDMKKEPNLGRYFWKAVNYTANDYTTFEEKYQSDVNIQALDDVNEEGEYFKHLLVKAGIVNSDETVHVPVNSNDELIPPFVAAKDDQSDLETEIPDYEEGISRLKTLLNDHFGDDVETVEDSASNNDSDEGSSEEEDFFLSDVDKVGPATSENIVQYLRENKQQLDWRNHIDAEEWQNSPIVVTEDEASNRLQAVALEMDNGDFQKCMQLIEEGNTNQAVAAIKQYE